MIIASFLILPMPSPLPLPCLLRPRPRLHLHPHPAYAGREPWRDSSHDAGLRSAMTGALPTFGGLHGYGSIAESPVCGLLLAHMYAPAPGASLARERPPVHAESEFRDGH